MGKLDLPSKLFAKHVQFMNQLFSTYKFTNANRIVPIAAVICLLWIVASGSFILQKNAETPSPSIEAEQNKFSTNSQIDNSNSNVVPQCTMSNE